MGRLSKNQFDSRGGCTNEATSKIPPAGPVDRSGPAEKEIPLVASTKLAYSLTLKQLLRLDVIDIVRQKLQRNDLRGLQAGLLWCHALITLLGTRRLRGTVASGEGSAGKDAFLL